MHINTATVIVGIHTRMTPHSYKLFAQWIGGYNYIPPLADRVLITPPLANEIFNYIYKKHSATSLNQSHHNRFYQACEYISTGLLKENTGELMHYLISASI